MLTKYFSNAIQVIDHIEKHGYEAYFVGGCVRDLLLERQQGDIDIATSATPQEIQNLFKKVIPVGIEHGTVIVRYQGESFEVTTFRMDGNYSDKRHPDDVQFIKNIEGDLARRDFTINALAMNKFGDIIDPFGGKEDLQKRQLRTVGNGRDRFLEDPLRIIRAIRFSSQLGFTIENNTKEAIIDCRSNIKDLAVERVTNEMGKFFSGTYLENGLYYLKACAIQNYLPVFRHHPELIELLPKQMEPIETFGEVITLFHLLNRDISIQTWAKAWKCSNHVKNQAEHLRNSIQYYEKHGADKWFVYKTKPMYFNMIARLISILFDRKLDENKLHQLYRELPIHSRSELKINGTDIVAVHAAFPKGAWIERLLQTLEKAVVEGELENDKTILREWVTCNPPEIN
ncbi:CCA tRNA nucleotidyltransferase [Virgibacillus sp. 179-BFC.A HS]|uniref:CCA-adding enzyme n=1 Tax=Tigheibacillus jepli TaxID=3035914 RepID=A0ABU5CIS6_9BACI|nr:CCA tRNA nucleotidyltransferase [Virgibacillus sp. 179-BFC.A HS]MDY0405719.1 CCA tRNA nucleotidyltransferase [Virgibacillus sp. 179-BFC.A HS]